MNRRVTAPAKTPIVRQVREMRPSRPPALLGGAPGADGRQAPHLLLAGDWRQSAGLIAALYDAGFGFTLTREPSLLTPRCGDLEPILLVVGLTGETDTARIARAAHQRRLAWIALNQTDDPDVALSAYRSGALGVLPSQTSPELLARSIGNALAHIGRPRESEAPPARLGRRRYRRGEFIFVDRDVVPRVEEGVIAVTVVHHDGAEVLLGLCGPGQTLTGHPEDSCSIQMMAHTDAALTLRPWADAVQEPDFPEQLRARLRQMEAWSAMQARPYLDQRLLGILSLLAEQFGEPHELGVRIDVRLTHAQLASAVGATRATITRILGDLRARGLLATVGSGEAERFCIREPEHGDHELRVHRH